MEIYESKNSPLYNLTDKLIQQYPHDVTLYTNFPDAEITLEDLETLLRDRIIVLLNIKATNEKGFAAHSAEWRKHLQELLFRDNLYEYSRLLFNPGHKISPEDIRRRQMDDCARLMTAVGYSSSSDKRSWFLSLESDMFRLKFSNLDESSTREFLKINAEEFPYPCLTKEQKCAMKDALINASHKTQKPLDTIDFYQVPFLDAPQALSEYMWIRKGIVYVPHNEMHTVAQNVFKKILKQHLEMFSKRYDLIIKGSKYEPFFNSLPTLSNEPEYFRGKTVTVSLLPLLSKTSFPLCVQNVYEALLQNSHLKYNGRQVFQLFLKNIGLPVGECVKLFRSIFLKQMDEDTFKKEYLYGIRHNYGLEGSRIKYSPPGCSNIQKLSTSAGDYHGCPFKNWEANELKIKLQEKNLSSQAIDEIMENVKGGHAKVACSKYFEHTHNGTVVDIYHPNQFFEESQKYYESLKGEDSAVSSSEEAIKREPEQIRTSSPVPSTSKAYVEEELMDVDGAKFDTDM